MSLHDWPELDPDLADAVRRAYVRPVDEVTARRHVSAIVAAAGAGEEPVARRPRPRRRLWRPVLAAAAAVLLLPAGLAVAGVDVPNAVDDSYRAVGITLPHQARHPASGPARHPVVPRPAPAGAVAPRTAAPSAGRANATDTSSRREARQSSRASRKNHVRGRSAGRTAPKAAPRGRANGLRRSNPARQGSAPPGQSAGRKQHVHQPRKPPARTRLGNSGRSG